METRGLWQARLIWICIDWFSFLFIHSINHRQMIWLQLILLETVCWKDLHRAMKFFHRFTHFSPEKNTTNVSVNQVYWFRNIVKYSCERTIVMCREEMNFFFFGLSMQSDRLLSPRRSQRRRWWRILRRFLFSFKSLSLTKLFSFEEWSVNELIDQLKEEILFLLFSPSLLIYFIVDQGFLLYIYYQWWWFGSIGKKKKKKRMSSCQKVYFLLRSFSRSLSCCKILRLISSNVW